MLILLFARVKLFDNSICIHLRIPLYIVLVYGEKSFTAFVDCFVTVKIFP